MVYAGEQYALVNVKAIEGPYPLRGELRVRRNGKDTGAVARATAAGPGLA